MSLLREILLDTELGEELKWGVPCYTIGKANVVLMHEFKDYCALLFTQGALLKDPKKLLIQQTENVQAARHLRFTSEQQVRKLRAVIKSYVLEAIANHKAGLKVAKRKTEDYAIPEEFQIRLKESARLKACFYALTPGRQRGYLLYFAGAKQSKTRESRIDKYIDHILAGKGLDD